MRWTPTTLGTPGRTIDPARGFDVAAFDGQPIGEEHRILASVETPDGYQLECLCGWLSALCPTALGMFDAWATHCIDTA